MNDSNIYSFEKAQEKKRTKAKPRSNKQTVEVKTMDDLNQILTANDKLHAAMKEMHGSYLDAHQAWHKSQSMADILIDVITANGLQEQIVKHVQEQMELEREEDFAEHEEDSYQYLIYELETRNDFLKEVQN